MEGGTRFSSLRIPTQGYIVEPAEGCRANTYPRNWDTIVEMSTNAYKLLLRPLLFRLSPERIQRLVDSLLKQGLPWRILSPAFQVSDQRLRVKLAGLDLPNPVGLAAGYDKDCQFLPSILDLGFGYVVGGTVTLNPCPGNPRPRVLRRVQEESLINALGFPSRGLEYVAARLEGLASRKGPIIVSIAGLSVEDFVQCHRRLEPLVDGVELNISSPNTEGIRAFQEPALFGDLLDRVNADRRKPLLIKLPPYSDQRTKEKVLKLVGICVEQGVDGVTAINTRPTVDDALKVGSGGLSGRPIFEDMLRIVADIRAESGNRLTINACGGIFSAEDAWKAFQAGASTVQLLTGLIYEGPGIAKRINKGLLRLLDEKGLESLQALVDGRGAAPRP